MAVTLNGTAASSSAGAATTSLAVTMPSGATNGELLVVAFSNAGPTVSIVPPGAAGYWTQLAQSQDGFGTVDTGVFVRTVDGTEGASQTFSFASSEAVAVAFRLGGVSATAPVNAVSAAGTATSGSLTAITCPSVAATVDGAMVLRIASSVQVTSFTNPGSHTAIGSTVVNAGASSADPGVAAAYQTQTSQGATGTAAFVSGAGSSDRPWVAYTIVIAPAAPTITTQPVSTAQYAGLTATFNIAATTSGGALSYQWKVNGSNVGTNSTSYTTAALTPSDNGSIVTCVVTDSNGSITSSAAILTVLPTSSSSWIKA